MATPEDYRRAADAVQSGNYTLSEWELNERAAKESGSMGNDARAARKGEKKW